MNPTGRDGQPVHPGEGRRRSNDDEWDHDDCADAACSLCVSRLKAHAETCARLVIPAGLGDTKEDK
jgi:hypothetical protein